MTTATWLRLNRRRERNACASSSAARAGGRPRRRRAAAASDRVRAAPRSAVVAALHVDQVKCICICTGTTQRLPTVVLARKHHQLRKHRALIWTLSNFVSCKQGRRKNENATSQHGLTSPMGTRFQLLRVVTMNRVTLNEAERTIVRWQVRHRGDDGC